MALTAFRTWVTGELVTAAMMNQQIRDNGNAIWVGTTAGDMDYYTGATGKARLPIGTAGQVLKVNSGATAPEWGGAIVDIDMAASSGEKSYSTTWEDHPGLTVTLALPCVCTVVMLAIVAGYADTTSVGYSFTVRGMIDGVADGTFSPYNGSATTKRNEAMPYIWYAVNVPAGDRIAKIQCAAATVNRYITNGRLIALAFAE